ncbi:hypothetical protein FRC20_005758 [Serendipita sp. 405]|nr:hypothetical protein FRC20_005758 [Serendipita sp. 405]
MSQPLSSGLTLLSASTIVDVLYPHLSVKDILNVSKACRATRLAVNAWLPSAYSINKHLEPFFGDLKNTLRFRSIQAETGTLISGSQALQFFDRAHYLDSDLDLYVSCRHTLTVGVFLLSIGYQFEPTARQLASPQGSNCREHLEEVSSRTESVRRGSLFVDDYYEWAFIEEVYTFAKQHTTYGSQVKIQIIAVDPLSSPLACILHFHSTLVMNFITHDRAYSLFPCTTFLGRVGITLGRSGDLESLRKAYAKYIGRNFRISATPIPPMNLPSPIKFGIRWIGDRQTWTIELDTTDVAISDEIKRNYEMLGRPPIMLNGFTLENSWMNGATDTNPSEWHYTQGNHLLSFETVQSPILRQPLILPAHKPPEEIDDHSDRRWTSYPLAYNFVKLQEKFEVAKFEIPDLTLRTVRPELLPGWQYWDLEALRLVQEDIKNH